MPEYQNLYACYPFDVEVTGKTRTSETKIKGDGMNGRRRKGKRRNLSPFCFRFSRDWSGSTSSRAFLIVHLRKRGVTIHICGKKSFLLLD